MIIMIMIIMNIGMMIGIGIDDMFVIVQVVIMIVMMMMIMIIMKIGKIVCIGIDDMLFIVQVVIMIIMIIIIMITIQVKRDLLRRVSRVVDRDVVIASSSLRLPLEKVSVLHLGHFPRHCCHLGHTQHHRHCCPHHLRHLGHHRIQSLHSQCTEKKNPFKLSLKTEKYSHV